MITRRRLLSLAGLTALSAPLAARAQDGGVTPPSVATLWSPGDFGERLELSAGVISYVFIKVLYAFEDFLTTDHQN